MSIEEVLPVLVDWLTLGEVFRVIATSRTMRATIINEPSVWKGLALHRLGIGMLSRTTHGRARALVPYVTAASVASKVVERGCVECGRTSRKRVCRSMFGVPINVCWRCASTTGGYREQVTLNTALAMTSAFGLRSSATSLRRRLTRVATRNRASAHLYWAQEVRDVLDGA
jgi:hypothetical protein